MSAQDQASWSLNNPAFTGWDFTQSVMKRANYVWNTVSLTWVPMTQPSGGGGGGGLSQIQDSFGNNLTSENGGLTTIGLDESFRFDAGASPILYIGNAPPGSSESAAVWKITKIDTTTGVKMLFPNGLSTYVNAWTNRGSLSYS